MFGFEQWIISDNVVTNGGKYFTQCTQYRKSFTLDELKSYYKKEYDN